jgi:DNA-binding beta-propeller fold protein YncE
MSRFFSNLLACAALFCGAIPAMAAPASYHMATTVHGPDGNWDYASFNPANRQLYVARDYGVMAYNVDTGAITAKFAVAKRAHSSLVLPGGGKILMTDGGANQAQILDAASGAILATIATGTNPDGAAFDPASGLIFVMNGKSGDATLIDPKKGVAAGTIAIGGELEFPAPDGKGRLYVNVADKAEVAVLDTKAKTVVGHYPLKDCEDPSGLAYIAKAGVIISVCDNGVAKVLSVDGQDLASLKIGKGPDAVIVDAKNDLAFVPSGYDGTLAVIDTHDPAHIAVQQMVETKHGAHTGALDPRTGKLYLPTCDYGPAVAGSDHRPHLPDTFQLVVVAPE